MFGQVQEGCNCVVCWVEPRGESLTTEWARYTRRVFTGLVQAVGNVQLIESGRLVVSVHCAWPNDPWVIGESIAINGCCLTLVEGSTLLSFDLSQETLTRTTLGDLTNGSLVNIERALKASDRIGGHIVQGHVDTTGEILSINDRHETRFSVDSQFSNLLVDKGSITIDGVSLTVNEPDGGIFNVALIPHTLKVTTLGTLTSRQRVNVEFDVLGKYALNRL